VRRALLAVLAAALACRPSRIQGEFRLRIALVGPLTALAPGAEPSNSGYAQEWVFEPLLRTASDGSAIPGLAGRFRFSTPARVVVELREGAKFSDGSAVTTDDVSKRIITQPNSFDIVDTEYFSLKKLIPAGTLAGMDAKKIKLADKITPVLTRGEVDGKKIGDQGTAPKKVFYLEGKSSTKFSATPTQWITLIPTVYNADTLGIRPDLIKRPIVAE